MTAILDLVCETFLKRSVSAILFLSNTELYGRNTAAAQYFLQLTNYLRIPVIAWNADNSGLEKVNNKLEISIHINQQRSYRILFGTFKFTYDDILLFKLHQINLSTSH